MSLLQCYDCSSCLHTRFWFVPCAVDRLLWFLCFFFSFFWSLLCKGRIWACSDFPRSQWVSLVKDCCIADVNSMLIIYQLYFLINWHLLDLIIITAIFNALGRRGIKMPGRILDLRLSMVSTHEGDLTFKGTIITYSKVLWEYPIKTKIGYSIIDRLLFSK